MKDVNILDHDPGQARMKGIEGDVMKGGEGTIGLDLDQLHQDVEMIVKRAGNNNNYGKS